MSGVACVKICGPKTAICCTVLSAWGVVQLLLMSLGFYLRAVAFIEDVPIKEPSGDQGPTSLNVFEAEMDEAYSKSAMTTLVASGCYAVTLVVGLHQVWVNNRASARGGLMSRASDTDKLKKKLKKPMKKQFLLHDERLLHHDEDLLVENRSFDGKLDYVLFPDREPWSAKKK